MSIFNSAELEDSVSQGVAELDGEQPNIDLGEDDVKNLKRELHKLKQKHQDMSEALNQDEDNSESEEFSAGADVESADQAPLPVSDSQSDEEGFDTGLQQAQQSSGSDNTVSRDEVEELREKVEENERLKERIDELESELEEVKKNASSSAVEEKVDKTLFDDRLDELEQKVDEADPDLEKRLENIEIEEKVDLSKVEEQFEEFRDEIEEEIGSMQSEIEEKTPDKSEVGSLWASLEMLEDRIEALRENTPDNNKMDTMDAKVESIKNEFSGIESTIEQLKERNSVTEEEFHEELEDFRRDINEEVSDFDEKISSQYATSKEVSSLWDALKQLEDRQDDSQAIIDQIDEQGVNEFGRLKDTTKYLEHKIQDLEALEDKVSQIDMLKQKLEDMEMVVQGMDKEAVDKEEYKDLMQDVMELSQLTKKIAQRNQ